ncbi:MAG TPA: bifunctional acetate--CoA ligase family protein/GNAT family N-acetyltransferase [Xanthobacteraceae bacterium]|nr:bifunctional acetate--CoA ligase family protein/GNAT family N-acetyltransferase [Xanthobacteraceae bacterium]
MSTYKLDRLFAPKSVALVGASPHGRSVGRAILQNLLAGDFAGELHLVNPNHAEIAGVRAVKSLDDLPAAPDLVVISVPPPVVPSIVEAAARKGAAAAIIITAGLGHGPGSLAQQVEQTARRAGLRLVGPNCIGILAPLAKLNASFAARLPKPGDLALISQSGAIAAGLVEWAAQRSVGFSAIASIGEQLDVDLSDLLDYFALDVHTRAILLYIESVKNARKFMSAARAAARTKPVVVVKSGRHAQGAKAAATHTGALAGSDAVYEAAFRRAGLLRVLDLGELFDAAETLGRIKSSSGRRLALLTNGGGVGVLAVDRLVDLGGTIAEISADTRARLDAVLPPTWSHANPVDIVGDADAPRYAASLEALLDDPANDAILVMNVQSALASAVEIARTVTATVAARRARAPWHKPVLAVWVGADEQVSDLFEEAGMPYYATEGDAVEGYMHLVRHAEVIRTLMETPPSLPEHFAPEAAAARKIVEGAVADGRSWLDPVEVTRLFEAYAIPIVPALLARTPEEAETIAGTFLAAGQKVVVKILSRDITHKSDVGGVKLNLATKQEVRQAAEEILANARAARPDARIAGVTVHPMILRPKARELIAGIASDPTFGPVIVFGAGGTAVEVVNDKSLALPPLDLRLAHDLIERTRVSRLLRAYRNVPAAKVDDVAMALLKLAQLVADLPEVRELDINPLLADETGVLTLDARVAVAPVPAELKEHKHARFAVRPYPVEWERHVTIGDNWRVFVRPVRPEDEPLFSAFFARVTAEDLRLRFFAAVKDFSHTFIARLTQLDYARAMAFVAIAEDSGDMLGAVRLHCDANGETGEYAILLRSDLKGRGLGWKLMELMIAYGRSEGLKRIEGQVLRENTVMLQMCRELGFRIVDDPNDHDIALVSLTLAKAPA